MSTETKVSTTIPLERVGVVIGREGATKSKIEESFSSKLIIQSETGIIEIVPTNDSADPTTILRARDVVTAIGRGFSPERALKLVDDDIVLDVIDLRETLGKNDREIARLKGRVIGREGKIRRLIEEMTNAQVSVYGHTISMLGDYETVTAAREAIELLLKGKQHSTVYKLLRKIKSESKKRETLELWQKPP
ncbi:MAG TPA: KH domain-containing protein [Candidatus Saccharimonadales bacterium]|nr:KH domain-containing protein [Candidatus Saccharimonadales bacterium]